MGDAYMMTMTLIVFIYYYYNYVCSALTINLISFSIRI
jgi:hypothetical protein